METGIRKVLRAHRGFWVTEEKLKGLVKVNELFIPGITEASFKIQEGKFG